MSDLTLKDLIKLEGLEYENLKFRVVRHKMNRKSWEDFDNLIRFDNEMLSAFAGSQERLVYKDADIIPKEELFFSITIIPFYTFSPDKMILNKDRID